MSKIYIKLTLLCFIFLSLTAPAALNLELTQGMQGAIPVAVVPFSGQPSDLQGPDNVAGVISTDLQNSGHFKLMNSGSMQQTPSRASDIDFSYWQKQDINDMVVGEVKSIGGGKYQVEFQLLNVYGNKANPNNSAPAWQNAVILTKTFTVNSNQLRGLSHHISDMIYESLTGDRGIFSTRIAYVTLKRLSNQSAQYNLEVSDYDGFNPKLLLKSSQPIMSPAWSADGRKIAYVSFENGDPAIFIQDLPTGDRQKISGFAGLNGAPAWSPDGRQLALVLTQSGYPKIYLLDLASKQLTQVTQGTAIDTEPSWSPNGSTLLFTSNRGGGPQIYRINLATKDIQRITYSGNYNARAAFSSDGKSIVVLNGSSNAYNIAVQDLTSGRYITLTDSGNDQSPSIAPNGKMVVYATKSDGHGVLGVVSTDGRVKQLLPAREGDVREPAWSPFLG